MKLIIDPKKFLKEVEEAKKKDYAIDNDEYFEKLILEIRKIARKINRSVKDDIGWKDEILIGSKNPNDIFSDFICF